MQKYGVHEVFTPATPARITFVERDSVNNKLVNALKTPGKQIVVYGPSGSGKTTLLVNKLHQLYPRHVTSRCTRSTVFDQLVLDAFDHLKPYYIKERVSEARSEIGAEYAGIKATIETFSGATQERVLPPQLTPQGLGRFLGSAGCCWVIEDFHKIVDAEKVRLAQQMKVFMDLSSDFPDLRIIAIGAVNTARQVVEYDNEMRNRVAEIGVPLMNEDELLEIIAKGEAALNISIGARIKRDIAKYSSGVAAVCHQLCLNMCNAVPIIETVDVRQDLSDSDLESALAQYLEDASDTLKGVFDKAFRKRKRSKYNNAKLIVQALCAYTDEGATRNELFDKIQEREKEYPASNLDYFLKNLQSDEYGALIRHDPHSGRFSFADPIYRVFALAFFRNTGVAKSLWTGFEFDEAAYSVVREAMLKQLESKFQITIFADHRFGTGKTASVLEHLKSTKESIKSLELTKKEPNE